MDEQDQMVAIDLHNKVTGDELEKLLRKHLRALVEDPGAAKALPPLMVWGAPGLGKSSILRDVAEDARMRGSASSTSGSRSASRWTSGDCRCRGRTA